MHYFVQNYNEDLTVRDNTDITSCLIHTSSFMPSVGDWVVAPHGVEMIAAVETSDHVDQVIQSTKPVICSRCQIHVDREEPSIGSVEVLQKMKWKVGKFIVLR